MHSISAVNSVDRRRFLAKLRRAPFTAHDLSIPSSSTRRSPIGNRFRDPGMGTHQTEGAAASRGVFAGFARDKDHCVDEEEVVNLVAAAR